MTINYDEKDLVSFGEYLLSKKRNDSIAANWSESDNIPLAERQSQIYHADLENWKHEQSLKITEG
jgi:hypothetical protein